MYAVGDHLTWQYIPRYFLLESSIGRFKVSECAVTQSLTDHTNLNRKLPLPCSLKRGANAISDTIRSDIIQPNVTNDTERRRTG